MVQNAIDCLLRQALADGSVPGVVVVAADGAGTTLYQGAFGRRSLAAEPPMRLDTVFRVASLTKAVTAVAAMQLVEQGRLALDQPAGTLLPALAAPLVLEGFDPDGTPRLRPARLPITLRRLLTHTAGFGYDIWNADLARYAAVTGLPPSRTNAPACLDVPLLFDPGERWEYGLGLDWAGRMVEAASGQDLGAYVQAQIFAPLRMTDTGYCPGPDQVARLAGLHARQRDGTLRALLLDPPARPAFCPGGTGLFSTAPDYLRFLRMLLQGGTLDGVTLLRQDTVALMARNQIGDLPVQPLRSQDPRLSNDLALFPGTRKRWGLSWLITTEETPSGRSAGSLGWLGLYNCYYWIDPAKSITGLLLAQILPFADPAVLRLLAAFEAALYRAGHAGPTLWQAKPGA